MEKFLEYIKTNLSEENSKNFTDILNKVSALNLSHKIYNFDFGIGVSKLIINNKLDYKTALCGLLYVVQKNDIEISYITSDEEIIKMLYALNSLEKLNISTKKEQLDSIKSMFIALAKDIRVIILKLCIEQQKLEVLNLFSDSEVEVLMQGYTDIYAPLSAMLGMSQIKNKLENATFKYYKPKLYHELTKVLEDYIEERNQSIQDVIEKIKREVEPITSNLVVYGRQKQLASIAKKLQKKNIGVNTISDIYGRNNQLEKITEENSFKDITLHYIFDILAVRVLVDTVDQCYSVLGKIFTMFTPFGNFKDYIAHPKENGYQSLHTAIILENGDPVEVQIRTHDMHNYAEYGFAAHWAYKANKKVNVHDSKINYIRSVMDLYKEKSSDELLDILKSDVYAGKIFVQSPQGKILEFPEGATPIDFAYAIHSKIGDMCVGAKINNKMATLTTPLNNGDMVEIITNPNSKGPSRDWLKICKTQSAKTKINSFFKKEMKEENIKKGKSMLESFAKLKNVNLSKIMLDDSLDDVYERYSLSSLDDMYASIGYGGLTCAQIVNKLTNLYNEKHKDEIIREKINTTQVSRSSDHDNQVNVKGFSNLLNKLAKCCNPLPGDNIIGYISRGKGVTIHRADCSALKNCEFERLIECNWNNSNNNTNLIGSINIITVNMMGAVAKISKKINDNKINISKISSKTIADERILINVQVFVDKKEDLDDLINKLKQFSFVCDAYRCG